MERRRRSLLEKYDIPLNHMDFNYVSECTNVKELEKIYHILITGEEGYYPDLTKCVENKLRELHPASRMLRVEEPSYGPSDLPEGDKPIAEWSNQMKAKEERLKDGEFPKLIEVMDDPDEKNDYNAAMNALNALNAMSDMANNDPNMPPMRNNGTVTLIADDMDEQPTSTQRENAKKQKQLQAERISSTDYGKWDKYNADVEVLKMDLEEERHREMVERKNRINIQKTEFFKSFDKERIRRTELRNVLSDIEREKLAEEYRHRGNEYYKCKEYDFAVAEYTHSIEMSPETAAASYNNRALIKIKQQKYQEAAEDCQAVINLDPANLKARLRMADATFHTGKRREAYEQCLKILCLDPSNRSALKTIADIEALFGNMPPPHATRLTIQEAESMPINTINQNNQIGAYGGGGGSGVSLRYMPQEGKYGYITDEEQHNFKDDFNMADLVQTRSILSQSMTAVEALKHLKEMKRKHRAANSSVTSPSTSALIMASTSAAASASAAAAAAASGASTSAAAASKAIDYDLAQLVQPMHIIDNHGFPTDAGNGPTNSKITICHDDDDDSDTDSDMPELISALPKDGKILIEEL